MPTLPALDRLRRLFSQEVARINAAQACVRMQHQRRQRRDLEAYLDEHRPQPRPRRPSDGR